MAAAAIALTIALVVRHAAAREPCSLRLDPPQTSGAWELAAREASATLAISSQPETDCADIVVKLTTGGAIVLFTTQDGRKAFREVASPGELLPTVVALVATFEPAKPASSPSRTDSPSVPPSPSTTPPIIRSIPEWGESPAVTGPVSRSFRLRAEGGVRVGLPGAPIAPTAGAGFTMALERWEATLLAQWEPAYAPQSVSPLGTFRLSATSLGLTAGRREPLGDVTTLVFGPAAFATMATIKAGPELGNAGRARIEPRIGIFAASELALTRPLRVRLSVLGDLNPSSFGHAEDDIPVLPPWGLETSVGVEWEIP